jgi:hypothetical protein
MGQELQEIQEMKRGDRVLVVRGRKAQGEEGTIFWYGPDKYGDGMRAGIKTDAGETHFLKAEYLKLIEQAEQDAGEERSPSGESAVELRKGMRVRWQDGGQSGEGELFWVGENKYGPGLRVGITDDDKQKHWLNENQVQVIDPDPEGPGE